MIGLKTPPVTFGAFFETTWPTLSSQFTYRSKQKSASLLLGELGEDGASCIAVAEGVNLQVVRVRLDLDRGTLDLLEVLEDDTVDGVAAGNGQPALEVPVPSPSPPALPETTVCDPVFDFIRRQYPGPQKMQELLRSFKERGIQIPCPVGGPGEGHELRNAGGKARFRLRCKFRKCKTSMELVPSQYWIKTLIEEGRLCRSPWSNSTQSVFLIAQAMKHCSSLWASLSRADSRRLGSNVTGPSPMDATERENIYNTE
ncbi:hypothetical protein C349_02626 [Cryptococcus neoformans var. grubii Br795]|nr:hypothetical protein C349_02626 [Cryptococcus neoformans var. grubii Br795]